MTRPIRDILAEAIRAEALGAAARPAWSDLAPRDIGYREEWCRRADQVIRRLADHGVQLVFAGEPTPPPPPPAASVIWRGVLADKEDSRAIAKGPRDLWLITSLIAGVEQTEQTFTLADAAVNAGRILTDDPEVRKVHGVMKQVAAALEIHRVHAAGLEAPADA